MSGLVTYELDGGIAGIVMDDGKVNALSLEMQGAIAGAFDRAEADGAAAVVLAGRAGVFTAGFDLRTLTSASADAASMVIGGFEVAERVLSFPRPVVIASTGHAIAMGVFLLLSGDYRIGAEGEYRITANEVAIGLTMPRAAIEICRQRLSPAHVNRAVLLAEVYSPEDAVDAGFLDRTAPAADVLDVAREKAAQLAQLNLDAHAASKARLREGTLKALRAAIEADRADLQQILSGRSV